MLDINGNCVVIHPTDGGRNDDTMNARYTVLRFLQGRTQRMLVMFIGGRLRVLGDNRYDDLKPTWQAACGWTEQRGCT